MNPPRDAKLKRRTFSPMGSPLRDRSGAPPSTSGVFASDLPENTAEAESSESQTTGTSSSSSVAKGKTKKKAARKPSYFESDSWLARFIRERLVFKVIVALRLLCSVEPGRDFSDSIHPCVVLEARRVVRTSLFIAGFLALHVLVATSFILQTEPSKGASPYILALGSELLEYREGIFWGSVAVPLVLVLPGAALFGLSWDIHIRSLETILMTRLKPFGVVYGKWMSKAIEAFLMASAMMPYLMARYYLWGSNPFVDTIYLIGLIFVSCCLSAIAIALSTVRNLWTRMLGTLGVAMCCLPIGLLTYVAMENNASTSSAYGKGGLGSVLCVVILAAPLGVLAALGMAASAIGPVTYNGVYIARKCALLLTLPWALGVFTDIFGPALAAFQLFIGLMLFVPILLEDMGNRDGLHVDVRIATAAGIADDSLIMPGWQTGVWWTVGSLALWLLPLSSASEMTLDQGVLVLVPAFSGIFFPFIVIRAIGFAKFRQGIFCMRPETAFVWYFVIQAFLIGIGITLDKQYIEPSLLVVAPPMQFAWTIVWTTESYVVNNPALYIAAFWPVPVLLAMAHWDKKQHLIEAKESRAKLAMQLACEAAAAAERPLV